MSFNFCVSYCTVTYNNEDKIENLIENIEEISSDKIDTHIYVVDNGSTDGTVEKVREKAKKFANIDLVMPKENNGFGSGNNEVLNLLHSKYHVVINPDVYIESFYEIKKMIEYMENNLDVGLLSPKILNVDGTVQKLYKYNPSVLDMLLRFLSPNIMKKRQNWFVHDETGYTKLGIIEHASGAFMFFRTETFKMVKGFDIRYFMYMEDADITRQINVTSKAVFFPYSKVIHEWQRQSHKKIRYTFLTISSMIKYFNKWGWKFY